MWGEEGLSLPPPHHRSIGRTRVQNLWTRLELRMLRMVQQWPDALPRWDQWRVNPQGSRQKLQCWLPRHFLEGIDYCLAQGYLFRDDQLFLLKDVSAWTGCSLVGSAASSSKISSAETSGSSVLIGSRSDKASNLGGSSNSKTSPGAPKAAPPPPQKPARQLSARSHLQKDPPN